MEIEMNWEGYSHIFPKNDLIEHNTDLIVTKQKENLCQCNPKIDHENKLIIHNSLDRREVWENCPNCVVIQNKLTSLKEWAEKARDLLSESTNNYNYAEVIDLVEEYDKKNL